MVLLLMVLPISGVCAQESFENGNFDENGELTWSYDCENYTLTISGSGSMESVPEDWNSFKKEVTIVEITDEVLNICDDTLEL